MGYILAITNQKGGVGKTTTAAALGAALQDSGKRVLLVDLDPQGSLTNALGLRNPPAALYEALDAYIRGEEWALADLVLPLPTGESLVPGTIELAACELTLVNAQRREYALSELLAALDARAAYDWVLIDCPPALGLLTLNALTAADAVLIPVTPEHMAVRGLGMLLDSVNRVRGPRGRRGLNPDLTVAGILITMLRRTTHHQEQRELIEAAAAHLSLPILGVVPATTRMQEAAGAGVAPTRYPDMNGAREVYVALAQRLIAEAPDA